MQTHTSADTLRGLRMAITGGTSGLGLALGRRLHAAGAQVAFIARDAERVARVAAELPGSHGIAGDVARKEDTHVLALQIAAALGGLDVLVHNASSLGPVPLALLADTECEDFEAALATNVVGPFRLTKALLGNLRASAQAGRAPVVLLIGSDAAVSAYPRWGAYGASKAALLHMGRVWHEELQDHGIAVLGVDPGDMDTPMHAQAVPDADPATLKRPEQSAQEIAALIAQHIASHAAARAGTPMRNTKEII